MTEKIIVEMVTDVQAIVQHPPVENMTDEEKKFLGIED